MILVTGASGTIGAETARLLAEEGRRVRLLTRDSARVTAPPGRCEVVVGDYTDHGSLRRAMAGAGAVLAVTNNPGTVEHDAALLDAARSAGVERLVKLSALGVLDADADDLITRWQRSAEERVRDSGLQWTLLRPRAFMSNTLSWAATVRERDTVCAWPADTPSACVDPRDVAAVAALALTGPGHGGRAYALTGPQPLTVRERVRILSEVLGRPLRYEEEPPEVLLHRYESRYGSRTAHALLAVAARRSRVDSTLERLLGRPARGFAEWVRDHAYRFSDGTGVVGG